MATEGATSAGPGHDPSICVICRRDPDRPPPAPPAPRRPKGWRGTEKDWERQWPEVWKEKWAKRVKVVAFGRCAKDYQAQRRPKSKKSNARKGVTARMTIWTTPDLAERTARIALSQKKSVSEYGAQALEEVVSKAEQKSSTGA